MLPWGWIYRGKMKPRFAARGKRDSHCRTKQEGVFLHGHEPQVNSGTNGKTGKKSLPCSRKRTLLMEKARKSVPVIDVCFLSRPGLKMVPNILSTRSVSKKIWWRIKATMCLSQHWDQFLAQTGMLLRTVIPLGNTRGPNYHNSRAALNLRGCLTEFKGKTHEFSAQNVSRFDHSLKTQVRWMQTMHIHSGRAKR